MAERAPDRIHLRDLKVRCIVGVDPDERRDERELTLNVTLFTDLRRAGRTDDLAETVDYAAVNGDILAAAEGSDWRLIEALAERVAKVCLAHGGVRGVRVVVDKPGAMASCRSAAVEIVRGGDGAR